MKLTNKEKYRQLCTEENSIPIFSQAWWLDSVTDGNWDVVLVEKSGKIQASLPYVLKKKMGLTLITQPQLTQNLGPWVRENNAKYARQLAREKDLLQELYALLPNFDYYSQNWHHSNTNWLPLYWKGFSQTTRYTYVINNISSLEELWATIDSSYRNKIRNAQKLLEIKKDLDIKEFYLINKMTFDRQGVDIPYSFCFLEKHHQFIQDNNAGRIFYAIDPEGKIHSALYLTWDSNSAYVHLVGENPELRNSGAGILLLWEVVNYTIQELKLRKFDFEGSMIESIERVRRDFGGKQTPYFSISKVNSRLLKSYFAIKDIFGKK